MYRQIDSIDLSDLDYRVGEQHLETPSEYNDWAYGLCKFGEYDKALPDIKKCMDIADEGNLSPSFLNTYAEILYGLGRLDEAKEAFNRCLEMYTKKDERRSIYEIKEKIRKKFAQ